MNKQRIQDFQDSETILYDIVMVDTCHYTCVKTHRMYNTKSKPQCKLWTLGDNDVSLQVHQFLNCTTLVEDVESGKAVHMVGQEIYGKSLYLLLNFAVNLKLL